MKREKREDQTKEGRKARRQKDGHLPNEEKKSLWGAILHWLLPLSRQANIIEKRKNGPAWSWSKPKSINASVLHVSPWEST